MKKSWMLGGILLGSAVLGTAVEVQFYDEALPITLNPLFATTMVDNRAHELYFDRLYYNNPTDNSLTSRLIDDSQTKIEDAGKSLRLTIKDGINWHNGKKFTANDVCFTIDAMLNIRTPSPIAHYYREHLAGCTVEKSNVAKVTFKRVYHNPRERLKFFVLPKSEFDSTVVQPDTEFANKPIGTGPMQGRMGTLAAKFEAHNNTTHHSPKITAMKMSQAQDPAVQISTLRNGAMHGIISVPPIYRPELQTESEVQLRSYDLRSWWFIALNTNSGPLAVKEVRQALNYSIDRSELREKSIGFDKNDKESPCEFISGPFVQSSAYYNHEVPATEFADIRKTESLLNAAGLDKKGFWFLEDKPVVLRIGMDAKLGKEATDLMTQIANQLSEAGFSTRISKVSTDNWNRQAITGQLSNEYDMLIGKWSFGINEDVNDLFQTRSATKFQGRHNIFNYSNPEVDATLVEYEKARTTDTAKNAYHKLHSQLADDLPYLFLWKLDTKSAWRSEVKDITISPYYYFTDINRWYVSK